MLQPQSLPWREPLDLASAIEEPYWVLLYSGVRTDYSGRYSLLACSLAERIEATDFTEFGRRLSNERAAFENAWFGYLGYGLKDSLEQLPRDRPGWLALPNLCMMRFHTVYQFDHEEKRLTAWSDMPLQPLTAREPEIYPTLVSNLCSNMSGNDYLAKVAEVIRHIENGDLYQANLTRKFIGSFDRDPDSFALFKKLCGISPAPYSAYIKLGDTAILSSSPELFLEIDAKSAMRTRPIKGTAPRFADSESDRKSRESLSKSEKDRAENLMIVDLMRNDFSHSCESGSIRVSSLFDVTTYATIHHMSSTVTGQKRRDCSTLDAVKYCFPAGSMTGAPKIRAMQLCSRLEEVERGVYSGAIGWFGGDGSCDLSVVIRTLLIHGRQFEFQVGGGIVADSTPEGELKELIDKSKGILTLLGISTNTLRLL